MQHSKSARVPSCRTNPYRNVRFGSKADNPSAAKIDRCPLWSKSGQTRAELDCPLSATSGLMHCNLIGETLGVLDDLHRLRRLNITKTGRARISISSAGLARPRRLPLASLPTAAKSP